MKEEKVQLILQKYKGLSKITMNSVGGNADWYSHCGKQRGTSSKKLKMELPFEPAIPSLGLYTKNSEISIQKNVCTPMFIAALFTIAQDVETASVPISRLVDKKKLWYICTVEFYATVKKKELLPFATAWMYLESVMLCEISQSE